MKLKQVICACVYIYIWLLQVSQLIFLLCAAVQVLICTAWRLLSIYVGSPPNPGGGHNSDPSCPGPQVSLTWISPYRALCELPACMVATPPCNVERPGLVKHIRAPVAENSSGGDKNSELTSRVRGGGTPGPKKKPVP